MLIWYWIYLSNFDIFLIELCCLNYSRLLGAIFILLIIFLTYRPLEYERGYLRLCKVADKPFYIQGDDMWNS